MKPALFRFFLLFCTSWLTSCHPKSDTPKNTVVDIHPAKLPTLRHGEAVATFGGGCFWAVQEEMKSLKGVREALSGYAGGDLAYPTYEQVGTDQTGHAETVQVYYDPKLISYDLLLDAFFAGHDPTQLNRQGPDVGKHYRSVIFYRTPAEKIQIEAAIQRDQTHHKTSIVTQIVPFSAFYPAEGYHQDYYRHNPYNLYLHVVSEPKVEKFREKMASHLSGQ